MLVLWLCFCLLDSSEAVFHTIVVREVAGWSTIVLKHQQHALVCCRSNNQFIHLSASRLRCIQQEYLLPTGRILCRRARVCLEGLSSSSFRRRQTRRDDNPRRRLFHVQRPSRVDLMSLRLLCPSSISRRLLINDCLSCYMKLCLRPDS